MSDELREFLGDKYHPAFLRWDNAYLVKELKKTKNYKDLWRKSDLPLYQQLHLGESPWRRGYFEFVRETMSARGGACKVLDYRCGIGWAGLSLLEDGFDPSFADYKNKQIDFLQWRLKHRALSNKVYDLNKDDMTRYPLMVCFDRLALYPQEQQLNTIRLLASLADIVIFNLNTNGFIDGKLYHSLNVPELTSQIRETFTVLSYKTYNHYAHLFAILGTERQEMKEKNNGE